MPALTPSFVFELERRMRVNQETEYARRLSANNFWANRILKPLPIEGRTERITWLLETATIRPQGPNGTGAIEFENLVSQTTELTSYRHGVGIQIQRDQLEDLDGTGLSEAVSWAAQQGSESAYYMQRLAAQALLNGAATDGSATAYDTVPFFADNTQNTIGGVSVNGHPFNPFRPSLGGYANWCHGAAATQNGVANAYPGALAIDDSVSPDVALVNLGKAIAYIKQNKMPNGVDPRFLEVDYIACPPRMIPRVRQLLDAKFIAQMAGALSANNFGAGSADIQALVAGWGLGKPLEIQEIGGSVSYTTDFPYVDSKGNVQTAASKTVTGSDTTWYIVMKQAQTTQLGSLLYVSRKPFKVTYYSGDAGSGSGQQGVSQVALDRMNYLEYHNQGRVSIQYGHPYGLYRFDAS